MDTMNFRCPSCLEEFAEGTVCPHCGFDGQNLDQPPFLKLGAVLQSRYRIGRALDSNGEGVTYLAFDKEINAKIYVREFFPQSVSYRTEEGTAVAVLSGGEEAFLNGKRRFQLLHGKLMQQKNETILNVQNVFAENNTVYAVLQHCSGGTLKQLMERKGSPLSWNQARRIFLPVMESMSRLWKAGIGHFGISPENLHLYLDGSMKLGGYCVDEIRRTEQDFAPELFPGCAALEQYMPNSPLTQATDVYAMAACILYAITGSLPQEADRRKYDQRLLVSNAMLEQIPPFVITALANALQVYAEKRTATFDELIHALTGEPAATCAAAQVNPEPMPEEPKPTATATRSLHARLPDFMVGLIAFLVSAAVLAHICVTYVRNDPDYPYIELGAVIGQTSSMGAASGADTSSTNSSPAESGTSSAEPAASSGTFSIPEGAVEVPDYAGKAYAIVAESGTFRLLLADKQFSDDVPEGEIISQNVTGYALPGSAITVVISRGPLQRDLPNVVGMLQDQAKAELAVKGFTVGQIIPERNDGLPNGTVIRFNDSTLNVNEKYDYGTVIDLVVSFRTEPESD